MPRELKLALSDDLDDALTHIAIDRGVSKAKVAEMILLQHRDISKWIAVVRSEPPGSVFAVSKRAPKPLAEAEAERARSNRQA